MKKTIYEIETIINQIEREAAYYACVDKVGLGDHHCNEMKDIMYRMEKATTNEEFEKLVKEAENLADEIASGILNSYLHERYSISYDVPNGKRKQRNFDDKDEAISAYYEALEMYKNVDIWVVQHDTLNGGIYDAYELIRDGERVVENAKQYALI